MLLFFFKHKKVLSRDSVTVSVDAVVYYRVSNPTMATNNIEDYRYVVWMGFFRFREQWNKFVSHILVPSLFSTPLRFGAFKLRPFILHFLSGGLFGQKVPPPSDLALVCCCSKNLEKTMLEQHKGQKGRRTKLE